jgi:predicted MFS family arabinose efflux permease
MSVTTRLLVDTGTQIFLPFLSIIAAGLGVSVVTLGRLVSLRSAVGLSSPLFGVLADRMGYRPVMRFTLLLLALGSLLVGASPNVGVAAAGVVLMGLGSASFVPTLWAYLSARLPYARRAQGLGIVEYAWALAGIVGLFLAGQLIAVAGWRAPFFVLSAGLLVAWAIFGTLPAARKDAPPHTAEPLGDWREWPRRARAFFKLGSSSRSAWSAVLATGLNFFAAMHVLIMYGGWLHREYGLGPAQLGTVALLAGLADLCGSGLVSLVSDRLGKRRSVLLGTSGALLAYLLLPFLNTSVAAAVASIVLARFCFEFTIVSNIPLLSEQVPVQRGKVLTLSVASGLIGNTLAGLTGPWAYTRYGVWGLGPVAALVAASALAVVARFVREAQ